MRKILTLLLLAIALRAQQPGLTGTVKGVVTAAGAPVAAVKIMLSSGAVSSFTATVTTDARGEFSVAAVPVGTVDVRVFDGGGNLAVTGNAELTTAGQILSLPIHLP